MNFLILRLIPYLYYFIREQYRKDVEGKIPTRKKRAKYRTIISVQFAVILLTCFYFGVKQYKTAQAAKVTQEDVAEINARQLARNGGYISRSTYEQDVRLLIRENTQMEYRDEILARDLNVFCKKYPGECTENTLHMIDQVLNPVTHDTK